ncbi:MAG TPA: hypothetical protein VFW98_08730 [Gemmatimonadaceae bacterium]|nr:hypothetical protein [Gemmatimonadaceae bacterium]
MKKPGRVLGIVVVLALAAFLLWSTLASQKAQCNVCVEFKGQRNCASASAASPKEAARSAQETACGVLAKGMDESISCQNVQPLSSKCTSG